MFAAVAAAVAAAPLYGLGFCLRAKIATFSSVQCLPYRVTAVAAWISVFFCMRRCSLFLQVIAVAPIGFQSPLVGNSAAAVAEASSPLLPELCCHCTVLRTTSAS